MSKSHSIMHNCSCKRKIRSMLSKGHNSYVLVRYVKSYWQHSSSMGLLCLGKVWYNDDILWLKIVFSFTFSTLKKKVVYFLGGTSAREVIMLIDLTIALRTIQSPLRIFSFPSVANKTTVLCTLVFLEDIPSILQDNMKETYLLGWYIGKGRFKSFRLHQDYNKDF